MHSNPFGSEFLVEGEAPASYGGLSLMVVVLHVARQADTPAPFTSPYTYSDMTGFQLRNATDPCGAYTFIFE